jgi:ABC-type multidrug transport system ATPase subunit
MSVLVATGVGVRHRRRWIVRDLDVRVEPGEVVAVVGPPGSGRTTALLALAGRLRLAAGKIEISGTAALGHVPDVTQPEPVFTVAEHVRERLALLGRPRSEAAGVRLYGLNPALKGWELSPYQRQVLGVVLAELTGPQVIALDGVDEGLDAGERDALWAVLGGLAGAGIAVLVTAREVDDDRVTTVVHLSASRVSTWELEPEPEPLAGAAQQGDGGVGDGGVGDGDQPARDGSEGDKS